MDAAPIPGNARLDTATKPASLHIAGDWTLAHYVALQHDVAGLATRLADDVAVDLSGLGRLDTAGAMLLADLLGVQRLTALAGTAKALPEAERALLQTVERALEAWGQPAVPAPPATSHVVLERIGRTVEAIWQQQLYLLGFIGLTLETLARSLFHPRRWRLTPMVANIEQTGMDAIPIVAMLNFMVGAVVAFLGATVLKDFGASIYTVDLVALAFLRELGVLLTAILMAGRTASAFTAQIGSMKANEEIDAIRTLGMDPVELLVLPRVLALLVALPMLTFVAMIAGIIGGGVVCALALDISPTMFLSVFKEDVHLRQFLLGLSKAPLFAFLIAVIGCVEGFKVGGSAQSVGEHTTSSVVQSIFVVILLDALAALFFMEMGW